MRFHTRIEQKWRDGMIVVKRKFLWLPKRLRINGGVIFETRWLERCNIRYKIVGDRDTQWLEAQEWVS